MTRSITSPLSSDDPQALRLAGIVRDDPLLMSTLRCARDLALPDWLIVAGAIYQTAWNALTGRIPGHGLRDLDLVWFDGSDLSWEGEDRVIRRVAESFAGWPVPVEGRNQARVHLWFEARFGCPYAPLASSAEGLGRYASIAHAVGIRLAPDDGLEIFAPFGLDDVFALRLRPNRVLDNGPSHDAKAARMKVLWPELVTEPW